MILGENACEMKIKINICIICLLPFELWFCSVFISVSLILASFLVNQSVILLIAFK